MSDTQAQLFVSTDRAAVIGSLVLPKAVVRLLRLVFLLGRKRTTSMQSKDQSAQRVIEVFLKRKG